MMKIILRHKVFVTVSVGDTYFAFSFYSTDYLSQMRFGQEHSRINIYRSIWSTRYIGGSRWAKERRN